MAVALPTCLKEHLQAWKELYSCQIWEPTTLLSLHITCSMSLTFFIHSRCRKTSCHPSVQLTPLKISSTPFIAQTSADQKWESHHYRTSTGRNSPTAWSFQAESFTHWFSWRFRYLPILSVAPGLLTCKQQELPHWQDFIQSEKCPRKVFCPSDQSCQHPHSFQSWPHHQP